MTVIHVGVDSWIIQDGNYPDFEGQGAYRFALEFYPLEIQPDEEVAPGYVQCSAGGAEHLIAARVLRATPSWWVIDIGVPMYQDAAPPPWIRTGMGISGRVSVGIDPFFYAEGLKDEPTMPDLFRSWTLRSIAIETTPWEETAMPTGGKLRTRREGDRSFVLVPRTDAWEDDGGSAHYVLECELKPAG
jgi:hypothetical protein